MNFIKKQLTLFTFIAAIFSTSIDASSFYSTITIPAPQLGGCSNVILIIENITLCSNEIAQELATKEARNALKSPFVLFYLKSTKSYRMRANIRTSTKEELQQNSSQKFKVEIEPHL